jgi:hypothetical protein
MKIRRVRTKFFHEDRRTEVRHTDMTKLIAVTRYFPIAPTNWYDKSLYFITIALEQVILQVQVNRKGFRLNETYHILVYADSVSCSGGNTNTIRKNTKTSLYNSKEVSLAIKW